MNIAGAKVLLTGAAGGIGRCIALGLARSGAHVALLGRSAAALDALAGEVRSHGGRAAVLTFDLKSGEGHDRAVGEAAARLGGLDALINNAGMSRFERFVDAEEASLRALMEVNVTAPMLLAHAALQRFAPQGAGHIVNIGSAFGSIAFPHFAAYSASKFALRGFSEALRRELAGSGVKVTYVAPRATATALNGAGVRALFAETGTAMDAPERVAAIVLDALEHDREEIYIGWPERFFVKLNSVLPRLVDRALASQNAVAARHVADASEGGG